MADTLLTPEQFLARFDGRMRQLEWTQMRIERVVQDNPWTNPETKGLWAEQISLTTSPTERRRIIMRLATPRWANREAVTAVYLERERMIVETGILHQVDHIVPLVHPLVCGLHCEYNLRVTTAFENQSKSNFFEIS
ncbi:Phage protein [Cupriavidus basilensis]|uniref:Phage protein n=1 Tax=Cupriavidus basilensis TaxID=68895 RepID=A0A0C4Y1S7_9BURK|nr:Phage protein [Cupriavidus basilensis]